MQTWCYPVPSAISHGNFSDPLHHEIKKEKEATRDEFHQEKTKDELQGMTIKIESSRDKEKKASTKYSLHKDAFNDVVGEIFKDFQAELSMSTEKMMDILFNKPMTEKEKTQSLSRIEPSARNRSTGMTTVRVHAKNNNTGNRVTMNEPGTTEDWGLNNNNNHSTPIGGSTFSNASTNKKTSPLLGSIMIAVKIKDPGIQKVSGSSLETTKINTRRSGNYKKMSSLLKARQKTSDDRNFTTSNVTQTGLTNSGLAMNNTLKNQTAINRAESIRDSIQRNTLKHNLSLEAYHSALGNHTSLFLNDTKQGVQFEITKKTLSENQQLEDTPNNIEERSNHQLGQIRGRELLRHKANVSCIRKDGEKLRSRKRDQTAFGMELAELVIELKAIFASITVRETAKAPLNNGNSDRMTFFNSETTETNRNKGSNGSEMAGNSTSKNNVHEIQNMNETRKVEESGDTICDNDIKKMTQNINNKKKNKEARQTKANLIANDTKIDKQIMAENEGKVGEQGNNKIKGKGSRKAGREQLTESPTRLLLKLLNMTDDIRTVRKPGLTPC